MKFFLILTIVAVIGLLLALLLRAPRQLARARIQRPHGVPRSLFRGWLRRHGLLRSGGIVLANANTFPGQLAQIYEDGRMSLVVDASVNLPVAQRYLLWSFYTDQYHARLCNGTTDLPLGISPDSPSNSVLTTALLQVDVHLLGAKKGSLIGIAAGAITHGDYVVAAPNGQIADLTTQVNGNYWVVGTALGDVAVANAECPFLPRVPMQVTVTNGAISAFLQ